MTPWFYLVVLIEAPILLLAAYLGGWWLYLLLALVALMGMGELYSALIAKGMRPDAGVGYLCGLLVMAAAQFAPPEWAAELMIFCVFLTVAGSLGAQFSRTGQGGLPADLSPVVPQSGAKGKAMGDTLRDAAMTALGVIYIPLLLSYVFLLCKMDLPLILTSESAGPAKARLGALLLVAAAAWISDTASWAIGHLWGRRKLTPSLSPNKTVEGALAGSVAAILSVLLAGWWVGLPAHHGLILGVLLAVATQIGDLAESVIKRSLQLKDFGTVVGPHGGMLDTFDAFLFAAPVTWFYIRLFLMP